MEDWMYVMLMVYAILGVGVTAFVVWLLPSMILSILENIPAGWIDTIQNYFYSIVGEINEFFTYKADLPAHRRKRFQEIEEFISEVLTEHREVNAGRRMPVSING